VFRPATAGGEYRIVYRFDGVGDLHRWLDSDEHASWLARAKPHALGPTRTSFLTGLESWFRLPDQAGAPPPPPYKMAILTWATIFPLITVVVLALGPLLTVFAVVPRLAITTAINLSLITWVVMPRVTRALRGWLYPH
jgi:antibiotic biosynthesis monooxygenase (ABM) superfamily enzyme